MCNRKINVWRLESHHIRPKSIFPELAYDLSNGIALCSVCHRFVVHGDNDLEGGNWAKFVIMFSVPMRTNKFKKFHEENQPRV